MPGTRYRLEVNPEIPLRLVRLEELASNLWYSWDRPTRSFFTRLSSDLWRAVNHSPRALLKRIDQRRLKEAADDTVFLGTMNRVLAAYDAYHTAPVAIELSGKPPLEAGEYLFFPGTVARPVRQNGLSRARFSDARTADPSFRDGHDDLAVGAKP